MVFNVWKTGGLYEPLPLVYSQPKVPSATEPTSAIQALEKDFLQEPHRYQDSLVDPDQDGRGRSKYTPTSSEIPSWKLQDHWVASQFMSFPVVTLPMKATLKEAWKIVVDNRYRHIPVVDKGNRLVGVVSDRDLLKAAARARKDSQISISTMTVDQIMKQPAVAGQNDTLLIHIALVFIRKRIGCMPITDSLGHVIGILTRTDMLRAMLGVKKEFQG